MRNRTDILVVGAGPAGATLARLLAAAGREVMLVDRETLPRHKPCGGGLPPRAVALLPGTPPQSICNRIDSVGLCGAWTGTQVYALASAGAAADEPCLVVDRAAFDAWLVRLALAAGARLAENCRVHGLARDGEALIAQTRPGPIRARMVAACDGVFSPVGRSAGFVPSPRAFCVEGLVAADMAAAGQRANQALFHLACLPAGYAWCFPRRDGYAVGMGCSAARAPGLPGRLRCFAGRLRRCRGLPLHHLRGAMIPEYRGRRPAYARSRVYLLGDAAGLVDPLTGEGIFHALRSADCAARAMLGSGEDEYQDLLAREVLPELDLALACALRFRRTPPWLRGLLMSLPGFGRLARGFVNILAGCGSYRDLRRA